MITDHTTDERAPSEGVTPLDGSPTQIAAGINELYEAGADEVIVVVGPIDERSIRTLGRHGGHRPLDLSVTLFVEPRAAPVGWWADLVVDRGSTIDPHSDRLPATRYATRYPSVTSCSRPSRYGPLAVPRKTTNCDRLKMRA